jgi:hypothetical protein
LKDVGAISDAEAGALLQGAKTVFFGNRTPASVVDAARLTPDRRDAVLAAYGVYRISRKRQDALLLIERVQNLDASRRPLPDWVPAKSPTWSRMLEMLRANAAARAEAGQEAQVVDA